MLDQLTQIAALGRVTTREDADGISHLSQFIQEAEPFLSREFSRQRFRDGFRATVATGQVTRSCDLPDGYKRCFLEVHQRRVCPSLSVMLLSSLIPALGEHGGWFHGEVQSNLGSNSLKAGCCSVIPNGWRGEWGKCPKLWGLFGLFHQTLVPIKEISKPTELNVSNVSKGALTCWRTMLLRNSLTSVC